MPSTAPRRPTREMIHKHALLLFASRGYSGTGLRDIAEAVGIEGASLYTHIDSKQGLLFDIMTTGTLDLAERLEAVVRSDDAPSSLWKLIVAHVLFTCERPHQTLVVFNELRELDAERRAAVIALRSRVEAPYRVALRSGIATGEFRPVDVGPTVAAFIASVRGIASWYGAGGRLSAHRLAGEYADLCLRSVASGALIAALGDDEITAERLHRPIAR